MVQTVGKKLQQARLRNQISIDEAARATKMRPDKIIDLENDNYTNFPNIAYAKGFLLIYAKFLDVDVSEFAETMGNANPVAIDEYEYLNAPHHEERPVVYYPPPRRALMPLLITALVLIAAAILMYIIVSVQRLGNLDQIAEKKAGDQTTGTVSPSPAISQPSPEPSVEAREAAVPPPAEAVAPSPAPALSPLSVPPVPAGPVAPIAAISPPPAAPVPSASPAPAASAPATAAVKEVVLKPVKKTWVKIQKDVPDSRPVYDDWLFPDARPLKLHGTRFWIQIKDPGAVEITRDGQPVASDRPSITIQ